MVQASQPDTDSSTPIPWAITDRNEAGDRYVGPDGEYVAIVVRSAVGNLPTEANARFIVRAVNNHAKLLAMLKRVLTTTLEIDKRLGQGHFNPGTLQKMADVIEEAQS